MDIFFFSAMQRASVSLPRHGSLFSRCPVKQQLVARSNAYHLCFLFHCTPLPRNCQKVRMAEIYIFTCILPKICYNEFDNRIHCLWGRVKFPTGGKVREPLLWPNRCNSDTDSTVWMEKDVWHCLFLLTQQWTPERQFRASIFFWEVSSCKTRSVFPPAKSP